METFFIFLAVLVIIVIYLCRKCMTPLLQDDGDSPSPHSPERLTNSPTSPVIRSRHVDLETSRNTAIVREIGFSPEVTTGMPSPRYFTTAPDGEILLPSIRLEEKTTSDDDVNPPSYEDVMKNQDKYRLTSGNP
ncbi:hypothetical protein DMENIID0001_026570 [Sergentomyia squamirostris]